MKGPPTREEAAEARELRRQRRGRWLRRLSYREPAISRFERHHTGRHPPRQDVRARRVR